MRASVGTICAGLPVLYYRQHKAMGTKPGSRVLFFEDGNVGNELDLRRCKFRCMKHPLEGSQGAIDRPSATQLSGRETFSSVEPFPA